MEFLRANYLNTTTSFSVNSNTSTSINLLNRDPQYQYFSEGQNSDLTVNRIRIDLGVPSPVSRMALLGMNYKEFRIFYNDNTANSFSIVGGDTITSYYTTNTDADKFLRFNTTLCNSVTIESKSTITPNQEKVIALVVVSDLTLSLALRPSASNYRPRVVPKQVVHKLSDGGTRLHNTSKKRETSFSLNYCSEAQRNSLYDIYDSGDEFFFCPFGTATGFDGELFEAVWDGPFNFLEFSDNAKAAGFSGNVSLKETPY